jgi:hypothetical protein
MKFYRVHRTVEGGQSAGYEFVTSKEAAEKLARDLVRENPREGAEVLLIELAPTRAGILAALNAFAGHPDNG